MNKKLIIFLNSIIFLSTNCLFNENNKTDTFINRWAFQGLCDFVFDPNIKMGTWPSTKRGVTFNPNDVKPGSIIFVRNIPEFFKYLAYKIRVPYIIVTHGHYADAFHKEHIKYLNSSKIIAWFGIHLETPIKSRRFHCIPIGIFQKKEIHLANKHYNKLFSDLRNKPKTKLIYTNFGTERLSQSKHRDSIKKTLINKGLYKDTSIKPFDSYMDEMSNYKFTASPRGAGIDCYRTWEALLAGSIPIVISSNIDPLYKHLPILVIKNWNELSEEYLNKKYLEITSKKYSLKKLYIDYWKNKILDTKKKFLEQYNKVNNY